MPMFVRQVNPQTGQVLNKGGEFPLSVHRFARVDNKLWDNCPQALLPDIDSIFEGIFEFPIPENLCMLGIVHQGIVEPDRGMKTLSIYTVGYDLIKNCIDKDQELWIRSVLGVHHRAPLVVPIKSNRSLLLNIAA